MLNLNLIQEVFESRFHQKYKYVFMYTKLRKNDITQNISVSLKTLKLVFFCLKFFVPLNHR